LQQETEHHRDETVILRMPDIRIDARRCEPVLLLSRFSHDAGHLLEMLFGLKTNPLPGSPSRPARWETSEIFPMAAHRRLYARELTSSVSSRLENIGSRRVT
jgi:hypothetical protein